MKITVKNDGMQAKYIKHEDGDITIDGGEAIDVKISDGAIFVVDQSDEDMIFELKNSKNPI